MVEVVNVKYVVPEFVVLGLVMGFEVLIGLLEGFFFNSTNEALSLLILLNLVSLLSEFGKGIDEDTPDNIAE